MGTLRGSPTPSAKRSHEPSSSSLTGLPAKSVRLGLSVVSGVLLFLSVPTFGLWPIMWVALVPAVEVARAAATPKRAFMHGWLTGAVANGVAFWWMDGLLQRFGH